MDDIRAVCAQELWSGEETLEFLQRHHRRYLLAALHHKVHVVFLTFDIEDVVQTDTLQFVVVLHEHETVALIGILLHTDRQPLQGLVGGFQKVLIRDGLQQIVNGIRLIPLNGILREGSRKDHLGRLRQDLRKLQAAQFRHLDIQENQLHRIVTQILHGQDGTVVDAFQFQIRRLFGITLQQTCCQRFIVDNCTSNCHRVMVICEV